MLSSRSAIGRFPPATTISPLTSSDASIILSLVPVTCIVSGITLSKTHLSLWTQLHLRTPLRRASAVRRLETGPTCPLCLPLIMTRLSGITLLTSSLQWLSGRAHWALRLFFRTCLLYWHSQVGMFSQNAFWSNDWQQVSWLPQC